jgi:hypothetical protein
MQPHPILFITYIFLLCYTYPYEGSRTIYRVTALHLNRHGIRSASSTFRPVYLSQYLRRPSFLLNFRDRYRYDQSSLTLSPQSQRQSLSVRYAARYGPTDKEMNDDNDLSLTADADLEPGVTVNININNEEQRKELRDLVNNILLVKDPKHIPSILTKNIELILSCMTTEDGAVLVESVIEDIIVEQPDTSTVTMVLEAIDIILSFGEDFVNNTSKIQQQNQLLLGKIIKAISPSSSSSTQTTNDTMDQSKKQLISREEELDLLLQKERKQFTPGFLRHVENECQRIASASSMTVESTRLLEALRIIQTRVLEEICSNELGETAQVLGQLVGYDTKMERIAVLDAGLVVRGVSFANELFVLTTEALNGFQSVIGGADPDLIIRVQQIHDHLQEYLVKNKDHSTTTTNNNQGD